MSQSKNYRPVHQGRCPKKIKYEYTSLSKNVRRLFFGNNGCFEWRSDSKIIPSDNAYVQKADE